MPNTSQPKRKPEHQKSDKAGAGTTLADILEQLLSILRPRVPVRAPVRRRINPQRIH